MVYSQKFVMCILVNGEVQKELNDGTIKIPFGTHYTVRLRNKSDREAVAILTIDGENVSGGGFLIPPRSDHQTGGKVDIRRHADKDVSFRFVDVDSPEAVDFGKNGPNHDGSKGVIEARFHYVKPPVQTFYRHPTQFKPSWPKPYPNPYPKHFWSSDSVSYQATNSSYSCGNTQLRAATPSLERLFEVGPPVEQDAKVGVTVEGASTGDTFYKVEKQLEDEYVLLRIVLRGYDPKVAVVSHRPVVANKFCVNCGTERRQGDNFCGGCGTRLS